MPTAPIEILHFPTRNIIELRWEDGTSTELPIPYLRGWCPCAQCQGHGSTTTFHPASDEVHAVQLQEVGAYALGIGFSDGHQGGIFTWEWLHRLAPASPPMGFKRGTFVGGTFVDDGASSPLDE